MGEELLPFSCSKLSLQPHRGVGQDQNILLQVGDTNEVCNEILRDLNGNLVAQSAQAKTHKATLALIYASASHVRVQSLTSSVSVATETSENVEIAWYSIPASASKGNSRLCVLLRPNDLLMVEQEVFALRVNSADEPRIEVNSSIPEISARDIAPSEAKRNHTAPPTPERGEPFVEDTPATNRIVDVYTITSDIQTHCDAENGHRIYGQVKEEETVSKIDFSIESNNQETPKPSPAKSQTMVDHSWPSPSYATAPASTQRLFIAPNDLVNRRRAFQRMRSESISGEVEGDILSEKENEDLKAGSTSNVSPASAESSRTKRKSSISGLDSGYGSTRKKLKKLYDDAPSPIIDTAITLKSYSGRSKSTSAASFNKSPSRDTSSQMAPTKILAEAYKGPPLQIAFSGSTIPQRPSLLRFLKEQGCIKVEQTENLNDVLVIGGNELRKTSKFLRAVTLGNRIVGEAWVTRSAKAGHLYNVEAFIPDDPIREKQWGFELSQCLQRDCRMLLLGKTIYFTPSLKKNYGASFGEIEGVARLAGAEKVISKAGRYLQPDANTIILALEHGDLDSAALGQEHACYNKDLLSSSILRGKLDLDSDEFRILSASSQTNGKKRGRATKK